MIKTREELLEPLKQFVNEKHPYDVPEFISAPITFASEGYRRFVLENTKIEGKDGDL